MFTNIKEWFLSFFARKEKKALATTLTETQKDKYDIYWDDAILKDSYKKALDDATKRVFAGRSKYKEASRLCSVPWQVLGAIHYRESHCDFSRQLLNGQKWNKKTTLVPKNLGPWESWEQSCVECMAPRIKKYNKTPGEWLEWIEKFNGFGYRNRGYFSPYVFAGTNYYYKGLYVADGKFDPMKTDKRVGALAILKELGFLCDNIQ